MVALAFIPNPDNKSDVDHINRNKLDNRMENLRWVNRSENQINKPVKGWVRTRGKSHQAGYNIYDPATKKIRYIVKSFPTLEQAQEQLLIWQEQYPRGTEL
jgi:hypothetical protein